MLLRSGDVVALGEAAAGSVLWRAGDRLHLTVIVKATFALKEGVMDRAAPRPLIARDVHRDGRPTSSIVEASDAVPYLAHTDVLFCGHAHASEPNANRARVRLRVDAHWPFIDKVLDVIGDRAAPNDAPRPFERMPMVWERAVRDRDGRLNPVGAARDRPPNLIMPGAPYQPGCLAPIPELWSCRRNLLDTRVRAAMRAPISELPRDLDWSYFQAAPNDQRMTHLAGSERLVLEGLTPGGGAIQSAFPAPIARVWAWPARGDARQGWEVSLLADRVVVYGDDMQCTVTWRGAFPIAHEAVLGALCIVAGVEHAGARIDWARGIDQAVAAPRHAAGASASPRVALDKTGTVAFVAPTIHIPAAGATPAAQTSLIEAPTIFELSSSDLIDDHDVTVGIASDFRPSVRAPFALAPATDGAPSGAAALGGTPFAAPAALDGTIGVDPSAGPRPATPFGEPAPAAPPRTPAIAATPFDRPAAAPPTIADVPGVPPPIDALDVPSAAAPRDAPAPVDATIGMATREPAAIAPFALPPPRERVSLEPAAFAGAPWSRPVTPPAALGDGTLGLSQVLAFADVAAIEVAARTSDAVPIVNDTYLSAATYPWQLEPGQHTLTVVVKGSFELVADQHALPLAEADPPTGDAYEGDDPLGGLAYASDFAIVKPKADVTLSGTVHAPDGSASKVDVRFRFGHDDNRFDRRLVALGERTFASIGSPKPFDRLALSYAHAFGGPGFEQNPAGKGYVADAGGAAPALPRIEDPDEPLRAPGQICAPAGFAPIPMLWQPRRAELGTFDDGWKKTRWPYFPADFDPAFFQAAPAAQQLRHLQGDEPFLVAGMHPEHRELRGALPGVRARCFVQRARDDDGFEELPLQLDTAHFDLDAMRLHLVWRGLLPVSGPTAPEVTALFVLREDAGTAPASRDAARAQFLVAQAPKLPLADAPDVPVANDAGAPLAEVPALAVKAAARAAALDGLPAAPEPVPPPAIAPAPAPSAGRAPTDAQAALLDGDAPLDGCDLSGLDLRGRDLSGRSLRGAQLANANLAGAKLDEAVLDAADLTACNLDGASLVAASLGAADLSGASGVGLAADRATAPKARFIEGTWQDARFGAAELDGADFSGAQLDGACFDDAKLSRVRLYDVRGSRASFRRAGMANARADAAVLMHCALEQADASGSVWEGATVDGSCFAHATLNGASFVKASCIGTDYAQSHLAHARFKAAKLIDGKLSRADLGHADLTAADLTRADLSGANLYGAETWQAVLDKTKLDDAFLATSKLAPSDREEGPAA